MIDQRYLAWLDQARVELQRTGSYLPTIVVTLRDGTDVVSRPEEFPASADARATLFYALGNAIAPLHPVRITTIVDIWLARLTLDRALPENVRDLPERQEAISLRAAGPGDAGTLITLIYTRTAEGISFEEPTQDEETVISDRLIDNFWEAVRRQRLRSPW